MTFPATLKQWVKDNLMEYDLRSNNFYSISGIYLAGFETPKLLAKFWIHLKEQCFVNSLKEYLSTGIVLSNEHILFEIVAITVIKQFYDDIKGK